MLQQGTAVDSAVRNASAISPAMLPTRARNRIFDFVRIFLASLVLLAHAAEITDGNRSRELLTRYGHVSMSFGDVGVDFFFVLSGYLIVRSWSLDPRFGDYLRKRLLRIVPGYLVAFVLSIAICGLLAPAVPHFFRDTFHQPNLHHLLIGIASLGIPWTPDVFPGLPYRVVNSSIWTLAFEFRCYMLVALFGMFGLFRYRPSWFAATALLAIAFPARAWLGEHGWIHLTWLIGDLGNDVRLTFAFMLGGCFYLYKSCLPIRQSFVIAALVLLGSAVFLKFQFEFILLLAGAYLLFALETIQLPKQGWYNRLPDISYGMYIYGWPIESLCVWYLHPGPWVTFLLSFVLTVFAGLLSWHLVERPMLTLKPRPSAPLPADLPTG